MDALALQDPFRLHVESLSSFNLDKYTMGVITHPITKCICVSKLNIRNLLISTAGDTCRH